MDLLKACALYVRVDALIVQILHDNKNAIMITKNNNSKHNNFLIIEDGNKAKKPFTMAGKNCVH